MKKITIITIIIIIIIAVFFYLNQTPPNHNLKTDNEIIPISEETKHPNPEQEEQLNLEQEEPIYELKVEKPASFAGVEMVTHKSEYGFEITYPKEWQKNESSGTRQIDGEKQFYYYSFTPSFSEESKRRYGVNIEEMYNPAFSITVRENHDDTPDLYLDPEYVEEWWLINGRKSVYYSFGGVDSYRFFENGKDYSVEIIRRAIRLSRATDEEASWAGEEALWILSTFKITD